MCDLLMKLRWCGDASKYANIAPVIHIILIRLVMRVVIFHALLRNYIPGNIMANLHNICAQKLCGLNYLIFTNNNSAQTGCQRAVICCPAARFMWDRICFARAQHPKHLLETERALISSAVNA